MSGPYIYVRKCLISLENIRLTFSQLTSEDSYQIATMGVQGLRVEIVSDGPPPEEEPECVVSPVCGFHIRVTRFLELRRKLRQLHPGWYQDR